MLKNKKWISWLIGIYTILFLLLFAGCGVTDDIIRPQNSDINSSISRKFQMQILLKRSRNLVKLTQLRLR